MGNRVEPDTKCYLLDVALVPVGDTTQTSERYHFDYSLRYCLDATGSPCEDVDTPPSNELLYSLADEVTKSEAVYLAVHFYINAYKRELEAIADRINGIESTEKEKVKKGEGLNAKGKAESESKKVDTSYISSEGEINGEAPATTNRLFPNSRAFL